MVTSKYMLLESETENDVQENDVEIFKLKKRLVLMCFFLRYFLVGKIMVCIARALMDKFASCAPSDSVKPFASSP